MSKCLYFLDLDAVMCMDGQQVRDTMRDEGLKSMEVYRAKPMTTAQVFWCSKFREAGETGEGTCGNSCSAYTPRNGKNGRCKFHGPCYEPTEKVTITLP